MSELQDALNRYGETSVQNFKIIHPIGEKVIDGSALILENLTVYLACLRLATWRNDGSDYHDAKFSTYCASLISDRHSGLGVAGQ